MHRKAPRFGPLARLVTVVAMTLAVAIAVTHFVIDGPRSDTAGSSSADANARERAAQDTSRSANRGAGDDTHLTDDVTNQQAAAATAAEEKKLAQRAEEEAARQRAEEEAARQRAEEEAARKAAEEEKAREEAARKKAEEDAARKAAEEEKARERAEEEARKKEEADTWVAPLADYRISAGFGSSGRYWSSVHTGLDLAASAGSEVGAVAGGTVIDVGWDGPYGNKVEVRHSDGTVTWYCHLSRATSVVGTDVGPGDTIGRVGSTGNSTGPHLHLEVHPGGGDAVNPRSWLADHGVNL